MKIKVMNNTTFYASYDRSNEFLREVTAYANGNGGTIYFGVEPDGEVCGQEIYAHTIAEVDEIINSSVRPKISTDIFKQRINNRDILAVRVNSFSTNKMNKNRPRFAVLDNNEDLPQLSINESEPQKPENDMSLYDFSSRVAWFLALTNRITDAGSLTRKQSESFLTESKLMSNMELNIPGMLLFGQNDSISSLYPHAYIACSIKSSTNKQEAEKWHFRNNLFYQVEAASDLICHQIGSRIKNSMEESGNYIDFPLHIIQSLIALAVTRRDYSLKIPIEIKLTGRNLDIFIPGFKEEYFLLKSLPPELCGHCYGQIFSMMKQTGVLNDKINYNYINQILIDHDIKALDYSKDRNGIKITIAIKQVKQEDPIRRRNRDVGDRKKQMLKILGQQNDLTLEELSEKLNISKATAKLYSLQLQEEGLLLRKGSRRKGIWEVVEI